MPLPSFPTLPGRTYPITREIIGPATDTQRAWSGKQTRWQRRSTPIYRFTLQVSVLRQYGSFTEAQTLYTFLNTTVLWDFLPFTYTDSFLGALTCHFDMGDNFKIPEFYRFYHEIKDLHFETLI